MVVSMALNHCPTSYLSSQQREWGELADHFQNVNGSISSNLGRCSWCFGGDCGGLKVCEEKREITIAALLGIFEIANGNLALHNAEYGNIQVGDCLCVKVQTNCSNHHHCPRFQIWP